MTSHAGPAGPITDAWLWQDAAPFEAGFERRVQALAAMRATLSARRPLGGREEGFLALYDRVRELDAQAFASVFRAPAAEAWTRRTFDALRACLAGPEDATRAAALARRLDAFSLFALALAHMVDGDLVLPQPLDVELPVNLPGTPLVVEGRGRGAIRGRAGLELVARPIVRVEGVELWCVPEALALPGARWPDVDPALAAGPGLSAAHAEVLAEALRCVGRYQVATLDQVRDHVSVVALQPEDAHRYPNASSSEHPGAMLLGAYPDPIELADHVIHEYYHGRLFALEGMGPLLEEGTAEPERYYSPWRDELRSMRGLLHGAYVFAPVHDYWRAVADDPALAPATREGGAEHAARIALELRIAAEQIERHGRLTRFGRAVFERLRERIDGIVASLDGAARSRALRAVREHVSRYDTEGQVRALEA